MGRFGPFLTKSTARPLLSIVAACAAAFIAIAVDVTHDGPLDRGDQRLARWAARRPLGLRHWASHLSLVGDSAFLAVLIAGVVAHLLTRRRRLDALLLCVAGAATGLLTTVIKLAFERSRPPFVDEAARLHSFSFPSGHASGSFVVFVLFALLLTEGGGRRRRVTALGAALLLAVFVGATRVVIPVHYLSDVLAGAALGIAVAAAAWLVRSAFWPRR